MRDGVEESGQMIEPDKVVVDLFFNRQGRFYIKAIKVRRRGGRHIDSSTRAISLQ